MMSQLLFYLDMTRHGQLFYLNLAGMNPGHGAILRNPGRHLTSMPTLTGKKAASIVGAAK